MDLHWNSTSLLSCSVIYVHVELWPAKGHENLVSTSVMVRYIHKRNGLCIHAHSFMSNLPVVHCLALGATKRELRLWSSSSSSTELLLLLSTDEVPLESLDDDGSVSSAESRLSLFCNQRRLELPRTPLLLLLPILVVGGSWTMLWAETMMEFIDKDTTKLRRNNFTVLDEIMVMGGFPFFRLELDRVELVFLSLVAWIVCDKNVVVVVISHDLLASTSSRMYRAKKARSLILKHRYWRQPTPSNGESSL